MENVPTFIGLATVNIDSEIIYYLKSIISAIMKFIAASETHVYSNYVRGAAVIASRMTAILY